jgi:molecular chaperone GrpE
LENLNILKILGLQRPVKEETVEPSDNQPTNNDNQEEGESQDSEIASIATDPTPQTSSDNSEPAEVPTVLQSELTAKNEEIQVLNDKYLRLAAEFENYKRRAQRDQTDTVRYANEKLLKDILPTVDNLERAIQCSQEQSNSGGLLEGVELTYKQFLDTLEKLGVKQVAKSVGEPFDPAKHQAVGQVESSTIAENCVVDEFQKGYFLQDRILRPAMVTVAQAPSTDDSTTPLEEENTELNKEGEQE